MSRPSRSTTIRVSDSPVASSSAIRTCLWLIMTAAETIAPRTPTNTIATSSSTRVMPVVARLGACASGTLHVSVTFA